MKRRPGGRPVQRTGVRLRAVVARWFDARTMELFIDPVLADLQAEYEEASGRDQRWRARWIWIVAHIALTRVVLWHEGRRLVHGPPDTAAREPRAVIRTVLCALAVTTLATLLQVTSNEVVRESRTPGSLGLLLVPSALPLSALLGLMAGILVSLRPVSASLRWHVLVLLAAASLSAVSFVMIGWVIPEANQAFRLSVFREAVGQPVLVPKGVNELTLGELRGFLTNGSSASWQPPPADLGDLAFVYHQRWAISCAPLVMALFVLTLGARWRHRRLPMLGAGIVVLAAYPLVGRAASIALDGSLPRIVAAWAPNAILLAVALLLRPRQPSQPVPAAPSSA
jgi:hypothetical protein